MIDNKRLRAALLEIVAERGGVVMVNGRTMIDMDIARSVFRDFATDVFAELHGRLSGVLLNDGMARQRMSAEIEESEKRLEKALADSMPILN